MIGALHPITLRWGKNFADRFSREESEALWERFAPFDAELRGESLDAEQDRQDGYLFADVPGLKLTSLTESWTTRSQTANAR